jgi:hypothetical protein
MGRVNMNTALRQAQRRATGEALDPLNDPFLTKRRSFPLYLTLNRGFSRSWVAQVNSDSNTQAQVIYNVDLL